VEVEDDDATTLVLVDEGLVEVQHAQHPGARSFLGGRMAARLSQRAAGHRQGEEGLALRAAFACWPTPCTPP